MRGDLGRSIVSDPVENVRTTLVPAGGGDGYQDMGIVFTFNIERHP